MVKNNNSDQNGVKGKIYHAPWEKSFDKVVTPLEEFIHNETTSSRLLMVCALLALLAANTALAGTYQHFIHTPIGMSIAGWTLEKSLQHWVNDGLMALFFFVVGLELKREILVGELSDPKQAALPIIAAIGGMAIPALLYFAINYGGEGQMGWGIPMATDIAFAIGVLVLLAGRVPKTLITFLVALAIVDDLGAVVVIALFYTETIVWEALVFGLAFFVLLIIFNVVGIRSPLPYFLIGLLLWFALLKSGVHATLAGVITALTIPARPKYDPTLFSQHVKDLIKRFDASYRPGESIMNNQEQRAIVQTLENGVHQVGTPLQRLEHNMHMPVAFIVIPLFAFINAGIPIDFSTIGETISHPITVGVMTGLIVGKFLGIAGLSWLAIKMGLARLPEGISMMQISGVALLAGIGFTMSIFIAELGFAGQPESLLMAKTGILFASVIAGVAGYLCLLLSSKKPTN
ncbi:MAG: Na+/H+ antiporter NhaA [Gammaproteobacteria bacterium]|nr:Na+/H+ antiporter NhaA [Gammaproteobacteria bacterium]